uniref:BHLH domain-containing protein n=1 Tax=Culex tarsalis TaxID=7177 RepID=A0A1Q3EZ56_CULTA
MLDIKKEEPTEFRMPSIKQEVVPPFSSSWEENNTIEHIDWDSFQLLQIETSEFMSTVAEFEQLDPALGSGIWGDKPVSPKLQIRNHDCMWSGTCGDQSHPGKFGGCGGNHHGQHPQQQQQQQEAAFNTVTAVAAASLNSQKATILTPSNSANIITPKINPAKAAQIPAGRSLLINPRIKQQQQVSRIPNVSTQDFLRERESTTMPMHGRPDTPLSLDEDPPEFKHNIDLATCTIGSNRLSLIGSRHYGSNGSRHHHHCYDDASSSRIINMLKEQLEDTERPYMTSSSGEIGSLTDLLKDLKDLEEIAGDDSSHEELDSDTESNSSRSSSSKGGGHPGGYTHAHHQDNSSSSSPSSSSSSSSYEYQGTHVGDHSYTLPKKRYNLNELGVQTPSDSEEEIDVVSIGEKNLPTNPTPRDRRALQSRVAHKIARKQAGGVSSHHHQHHHRRRHSDDESGYQQQFANGVAGPSGGSSSHFQSPGKYGLSPNYLTPASSTSISGTNTPLPAAASGSGSRKRPSKDDRKNRHRSNKKQRGGSGGHSVPGGSKKSPVAAAMPPSSHHASPATESSEEQETLEKRNLHNDMERQRRIGLKNLFEELKRQIPSLREKERAPKVNILREAAQLCNRLNREQEQLNALRKQQQRLYNRVRELRKSLHSQRRTMD